MSALLAFLAGFVIETACVYWVHYSERGHALPTAACSAAIAAAQVTGIGEALHSWPARVAYVGGFALGTYTAVRRAKR